MSNYVILSDLIEKVSGQSYGSFLQKTFFDPLGMNTSAVLYHNAPSTDANAGLFFDLLGITSTYESHDTPPANVAVGYIYKNGRYQTRAWNDMSWVGEASSLYSTVEDLYRWNQGVFGHKVLNDESLAAILTPIATDQTKNVKRDAGRGLAYTMERFRNARLIDGWFDRDGFAADIMYLPDQNFTVVILTNAYPAKRAIDPEMLTKEIIAFYLGPELSVQPPEPREASVPVKALAAIVGRYDCGDSVETISREGDRVFAQIGVNWRCEIFPASETKFFWKGTDSEGVAFVKDAGGQVLGAIFHYRNGYSEYAPRLPDIAEIKLDDAHSAPILGQYANDQDKIIWTISREDSRLYAQRTGDMLVGIGDPKYELSAISETEFFLKETNKQMTFVKDAKGDVTSVIIRGDGMVRTWQKVKPAVPAQAAHQGN